MILLCFLVVFKNKNTSNLNNLLVEAGGSRTNTVTI